jgi:hypothetical protein
MGLGCLLVDGSTAEKVFVSGADAETGVLIEGELLGEDGTETLAAGIVDVVIGDERDAVTTFISSSGAHTVDPEPTSPKKMCQNTSRIQEISH